MMLIILAAIKKLAERMLDFVLSRLCKMILET